MDWYLQLNLAILIFGVFALIVSQFSIRAGQKTKIHAILLVAAIFVLPVTALLPESGYEFPQRGVLQAPMSTAVNSIEAAHASFSTGMTAEVYHPHYIQFLMYFVIFSFLSLIVWKTVRTLGAISKTYRFKKIGKINILISQQPHSPYTFCIQFEMARLYSKVSAKV